MDPIAHTLAGATMAQTRLGETTPLATATLVIGANAPDIDAVVTFAGSDLSLLLRRGWTHGLLALIVLPLLLTGAIIAYDRLWRRRRSPDKPAVKPPALLGLSFLGVLSHFFLDWLNTYGIRLLAPFDDRWFYGDTLFILDPWLWLLVAATVVFAHSRTRLSQAAWVVLGGLASLLVTAMPVVPVAAKVGWWLGIVVIVILRVRGVEAEENRRMAVVCVVAIAVYLAAMMLGNSWARKGVVDYLGDEGVEVEEVMTGPLPANPLARQVVAVTDSHYYGLEVDLIGEPRFRQRYEPVPIEEPGPIVARALADESIRGFANWVRYPVYEVRRHEESYEVIIRDLRYVRPDEVDRRGIGMVTVEIDGGNGG